MVTVASLSRRTNAYLSCLTVEISRSGENQTSCYSIDKRKSLYYWSCAHSDLRVHTIKPCAINWQKALSGIKGIHIQPPPTFPSHRIERKEKTHPRQSKWQPRFSNIRFWAVFFLERQPLLTANVSAIRPERSAKRKEKKKKKEKKNIIHAAFFFFFPPFFTTHWESAVWPSFF